MKFRILVTRIKHMKIKRIDQSFVGSKSIFYIEGDIHRESGKQHMYNQMYVEAIFPSTRTKEYPVVMFHGAGQTNVTN